MKVAFSKVLFCKILLGRKKKKLYFCEVEETLD